MNKPISAELKKLALAQLGSRTNKLMGTSSKLNKFLDGNFEVPSRIKDVKKWQSEQHYGVANQKLISDITAEAMGRNIKDEVDNAIKELKVSVLTKEQEAKVPSAIKAYESFLNDYVRQMKVVHGVVNPTASKKQDKVEVEALPNELIEV